MASRAPSDNSTEQLAVVSPAVGSPKERVFARPRREITTISPELAVRLL
jgi:hypothetical protein